MKKKLTYSVFIIVLLVLTLLTYNETIKFNLLIHSSAPIEKTLLQERNQGLQGARLQSILQNPKNPHELIAKGSAGNYYSKDNGESWQLLTISDQKYAGGTGYDSPNVYWTKQGVMVTTLRNSIYWSNNGVDWKSKWINYNVGKCGIDKKGDLWISRGVKGQKEDTYEYINWNKGNMPTIQVITNTSIINRIHKEDAIVSRTPPKLWKIEQNLIFKKKDGSSAWVQKTKGIERPLILYFFQDSKNPKIL